MLVEEASLTGSINQKNLNGIVARVRDAGRKKASILNMGVVRAIFALSLWAQVSNIEITVVLDAFSPSIVWVSISATLFASAVDGQNLFFVITRISDASNFISHVRMSVIFTRLAVSILNKLFPAIVTWAFNAILTLFIWMRVSLAELASTV